MIAFNKPFVVNKEFEYIQDAAKRLHLSGDGFYTKQCNEWLQEKVGSHKALLTHSCTAALEMAAILADIKPGDEVIMPSYTFVSTANAFVLRGGIPVFIDIRPDTLNMDETKIEQAISSKTKAIVPVHYAGVACEMDTIMDIAKTNELLVIEDAAQGVGSTYKGRPLGSIGHLGTLSFHETKNIICGEGGALLINDSCFSERAEIIREKGTNRSKFFRGQVDKYCWVDIGSSFLPSDILAAFLWGQMECAAELQKRRLEIWQRYHRSFENLVKIENVQRPSLLDDCKHNGHLYYLILSDLEQRSRFVEYMKERGIIPTFHYIPLHSSPAGIRYGKTIGDLIVTNRISDCLVRLPLWGEMTDAIVDEVVEKVYGYFRSTHGGTVD